MEAFQQSAQGWLVDAVNMAVGTDENVTLAQGGFRYEVAVIPFGGRQKADGTDFVADAFHNSMPYGLQEALALAKAGMIKKVLVHEVSRLVRRPSGVMSVVEALEGCCVSLYWHAQSIETLLPNCKRNPATGIMLALLAEMARAEEETMRERINSGLAEARRKGVTLGRPVGGGLDAAALLVKHKDVVKALKAGQSVRNAAKITGKGPSTVQRVAAALKA